MKFLQPDSNISIEIYRPIAVNLITRHTAWSLFSLHHRTCGISSLLRSVNFILLTLLDHLILRESPHHMQPQTFTLNVCQSVTVILSLYIQIRHAYACGNYFLLSFLHAHLTTQNLMQNPSRCFLYNKIRKHTNCVNNITELCDCQDRFKSIAIIMPCWHCRRRKCRWKQSACKAKYSIST